MKFRLKYLKEAHLHSIHNKDEISKSKICGCFHCNRIFKSEEIVDWVDDDDPKSDTALCPFCSIDAVIGSDSGYPVSNRLFLEVMHLRFFKF